MDGQRSRDQLGVRRPKMEWISDVALLLSYLVAEWET